MLQHLCPARCQQALGLAPQVRSLRCSQACCSMTDRLIMIMKPMSVAYEDTAREKQVPEIQIHASGEL